MKFRLENVKYMPKVMESGVLYVSKEFSTAAHLCACECGAKIRTPLSRAEWSVEETKTGPTMRPSIGNWQQPCRSHYVIWRGEIRWAKQWSAEQIAAGRFSEVRRLKAYINSQNNVQQRPVAQLSHWVRNWFDSRE